MQFTITAIALTNRKSEIEEIASRLGWDNPRIEWPVLAEVASDLALRIATESEELYGVPVVATSAAGNHTISLQFKFDFPNNKTELILDALGLDSASKLQLIRGIGSQIRSTLIDVYGFTSLVTGRTGYRLS